MRIRCISSGAPHVATYDVSTTLNVCVSVCLLGGCASECENPLLCINECNAAGAPWYLCPWESLHK